MEEAVDSAKLDSDASMPKEVLSGLAELGLFGLQIPEEYGGLGLSNTQYARVAEEMAQDASVAVTLMAHQSIGLKGILLVGNEEQKSAYLPKLAAGEHIASFALTEPSSGSDAASVQTRATLSEDGKHWLLNGSKIWISNGGWADVFTVFARTDVKNEETGEIEDKITAFIVERDFGGLTNGPPEHKLGIRASNTVEVFFDNCPVPTENVLGEVGGGFKVAMMILNNGRFGLGAGTAGGMKKLLALTAEHATTRKQFGSTLSSFGLIQKKFADIAADAYIAESMAYQTTKLIDAGVDASVEAAMCKVYGSEAMWSAVNECLQIHGGLGFMQAMPFERIMRDTRILPIFEGTNEILRLFIALTGVQHAGKELRALAKAAKNPMAHIGTLSEYAQKTVGRKLGVGGAKLPPLHSDVSAVAEQLESRIQAFGGVVDALLQKHGKNIINEQLQLERLANIAIDLYAMSTTAARASAALEASTSTAAHEALLAVKIGNDASRRIDSALAAISAGGKADEVTLSVGEQVLSAGAYLPPHPLTV
eukprot:PLAT3867.2.p1 GENE.PLAT3867.2~~PLAT3867.2.p1  ORF type:complete len:622 (-),score=249.41 PLAT3867.2:86-1696(-)